MHTKIVSMQILYFKNVEIKKKNISKKKGRKMKNLLKY
jgi:hypothetical protein